MQCHSHYCNGYLAGVAIDLIIVAFNTLMQQFCITVAIGVALVLHVAASRCFSVYHCNMVLHYSRPLHQYVAFSSKCSSDIDYLANLKPRKKA